MPRPVTMRKVCRPIWYEWPRDLMISMDRVVARCTSSIRKRITVSAIDSSNTGSRPWLSALGNMAASSRIPANGAVSALVPVTPPPTDAAAPGVPGAMVLVVAAC